MSSRVAETLLSQCPKVVAGLDWPSLALTPRDGFVLSRIDGSTSVRLLADVTGLRLDDVVGVLERLEAVGAVQWAGANGHSDVVPTPPQNGTELPVAPAESPESADANDLSAAERRLITAVAAHVGELTHWELLELCGSPSSSDVKRAYFAQSRRFHPDRYFGKNLGSFKARLESIFKAIKRAYEALANDDSRAAYAAPHPPPTVLVPLDVRIARLSSATDNDAKAPAVATASSVAAPATSATTAASAATTGGHATAAIDSDLERHRQEILAMRKGNRLDASYSLSQAQTHAAAGRALLEAGDAQAALDHFKRATLFDPANSAYRQLFEQAQAHVRGQPPAGDDRGST